MSEDYIPFSEIVAALKKLSTQRVTGTLFIATKANRSAQVVLERGEIVFLYFFNKRGQEALNLMSTIRAGRYRFQEGPVSRRCVLPSTDALLQSLTSAENFVDQPGEQPPTGSGLTKEQKNILETTLAGYIGPMAGIICEDHLGTAADLMAAIDALAAEIPSSMQAEKFRIMVAQKLVPYS